MTQSMGVEAYLAGGGILSAPANAPPRYRAELMKIMATFVDSELAGAAGFADMINAAPGIAERIAAARIVLQKTGHAGRVLRLMGEFGADTARYAAHHPWAARLDREAPVGTAQDAGDMRLAVFDYPLQGWADAVVMNLLMGRAVAAQMGDMVRLSYQPLAAAFREIAPRERDHTERAVDGLRRLVGAEAHAQAGEDAVGRVQLSVDYWWPRVAASFGAGTSRHRDRQLRAYGLRFTAASEQKAAWAARTAETLVALGLRAGGRSPA